jgi:hypothetical protein
MFYGRCSVGTGAAIVDVAAVGVGGVVEWSETSEKAGKVEPAGCLLSLADSRRGVTIRAQSAVAVAERARAARCADGVRNGTGVNRACRRSSDLGSSDLGRKLEWNSHVEKGS